MGIEIVFFLIYPVALICVCAAIILWFPVAKPEQPTISGYARGYLLLVIGFSASMAGLVFLTYVDCFHDFTELVRGGYYTETQRPIYLPARVVGLEIVNLVFVLPAIWLVVVPWTVRLLRKNNLQIGGIGVRSLIAWMVLSLIGWLFNLGVIVPPEPLSSFLVSAAIPTLIYSLPIPIAALFLCRRVGRISEA